MAKHAYSRRLLLSLCVKWRDEIQEKFGLLERLRTWAKRATDRGVQRGPLPENIRHARNVIEQAERRDAQSVRSIIVMHGGDQ